MQSAEEQLVRALLAPLDRVESVTLRVPGKTHARTQLIQGVGVKRALLTVSTVAAVAATTAVLVPSDVGSTSRDTAWTWASPVPGAALVADAQTVSAARRGSVDPTHIGAVISATIGQQHHELLAGQNDSGDRCFSLRSEVMHGPFECLSLLTTGGEPLILYKVAGGSDQGRVDWTSVLGVVRQDVARLEARYVDGVTQRVALNAWRAFMVMSRGSNHLAEVTAYDAEGRRLYAAPVSAVPPLTP